MKKFAVVFVFSLFLASVAFAEEALTLATPEAAATEVVASKKYICLMDGFTSDKPGKCEKCGMELIETDVPAEATPVAEAAATE